MLFLLVKLLINQKYLIKAFSFQIQILWGCKKNSPAMKEYMLYLERLK